MLALRLTRVAHPAVHLRRLLVATASAGTGFLLLCTLGYAMSHPDLPATSLLLRLAWCAVPLAATVHFAVAVARTDPATRPRPGLSAIGLGPARLTAISATTTALATTLGSMLALLVFLHLRGDLTGMPFDGAASDFLAANTPLPLPAALTLLAVAPTTACTATALVLRPTKPAEPAGSRAAGAARVGAGGIPTAPGSATHPAAPTDLSQATPDTAPDPYRPPRPTPAALPWGIATLAAGLAVEAYANRSAAPATLAPDLPDGLATGPTGVLIGWLLTALGLALAGPGLTHLCGLLLQSVRPGALRLLAGRILMEESTRIGRPLGVVCAVVSAAYAMVSVYDPARDNTAFGPLTTLGAVLVTGCTVATLLTAAVEAGQARADTTAALVRLGAPARTLRSAAALRAAALLALFGPLTLVVAELAALPLAR